MVHRTLFAVLGNSPASSCHGASFQSDAGQNRGLPQKFACIFPASRQFGLETGSLVTAPSSGESYRNSAGQRPAENGAADRERGRCRYHPKPTSKMRAVRAWSMPITSPSVASNLFDHVHDIGAEEAARFIPGRMAPGLAGLRIGAFWEPGDSALISLPGPAWLGAL